MALSDALKIETAVKQGPRCRICVLVETLDKDDAAALAAAFANSSITSAAISRALEREGHKAPGESVRRHRDLRCAGAA
jgi:hypothetical protein